MHIWAKLTLFPFNNFLNGSVQGLPTSALHSDGESSIMNELSEYPDAQWAQYILTKVNSVYFICSKHY